MVARSQLAVLLLGCLPLSSCITKSGKKKTGQQGDRTIRRKDIEQKILLSLLIFDQCFFVGCGVFPQKPQDSCDQQQIQILTFIFATTSIGRKKHIFQGGYHFKNQCYMMLWHAMLVFQKFIQILDSSPTSESV